MANSLDPLGKRALYSAATPLAADPLAATPLEADEPVRSEDPLAQRGSFTVRCQRCHQVTRVGLLDLLIFQFPIGIWIPRGKFDRRMTCPSCRKRAWCSVTLRRD
jgi:hypothetical protein